MSLYVREAGIGYFWSLQDVDLFTDTIRAWVTNSPLPSELVLFSKT